jgi:hypothetical protein
MTRAFMEQDLRRIRPMDDSEKDGEESAIPRSTRHDEQMLLLHRSNMKDEIDIGLQRLERARFDTSESIR